jgi:hypothetical protein
MVETSTSSIQFDDLRPEVKTRITSHLGEQGAQVWFERPNPLMGGRKPSEVLSSREAQGHFLDATCGWPLEDAERNHGQTPPPEHNHDIPQVGGLAWSDACNFYIAGCPACSYYFEQGQKK